MTPAATTYLHLAPHYTFTYYLPPRTAATTYIPFAFAAASLCCLCPCPHPHTFTCPPTQNRNSLAAGLPWLVAASSPYVSLRGTGGPDWKEKGQKRKRPQEDECPLCLACLAPFPPVLGSWVTLPWVLCALSILPLTAACAMCVPLRQTNSSQDPMKEAGTACVRLCFSERGKKRT